MGQQINPWEQHASPTMQPAAEPALSDSAAVWDAYRRDVMAVADGLGLADAEAREQTQARQTAVGHARTGLAEATFARQAVDARVEPFDRDVARLLDETGVSADGAGTGTVDIHVTTPADVTRAMDELLAQMHTTSANLARARQEQAATRGRWLGVGIVIAATLIAWWGLGAIAATSIARVSGAVTTLAATTIARRSGWIPAAITGGVTVGAILALVAATNFWVSSIVLPLVAIAGVIVLARPRRRPPRRAP